MASTYTEQLEKIVSRFQPQENGCWYLGASNHPGVTKPDSKGYSNTKIGWPNSKSIRVHKLSWLYYKGDIPEGMVIDHMCHNPSTCVGGVTCQHRRCVNPDHLQLITAPENNAKTVRVLKYRTHCKNGHKLEDNTYQYKSGKYTRFACYTCKKEQTKMNQRKYRAEKVGV